MRAYDVACNKKSISCCELTVKRAFRLCRVPFDLQTTTGTETKNRLEDIYSLQQCSQGDEVKLSFKRYEAFTSFNFVL